MMTKIYPAALPRLLRHFMGVIVAVGFLLSVGLVGGDSAQAGHGPTHPPVDVVFIIDESGSMGPDQADVQANVTLIANTLGATLDPQFALVGYGGTDGGGPDQDPHTHTDFTDAATFATAVGGLVAFGGKEDGVEATAYSMTSINGYRTGAGVCVVLVTDEDSDDTSGAELIAANALLDGRSAVWFGIVALGAGNTSTMYGPSAGSMSEHTGGSVFGILDFRNDPAPVLAALSSACVAAVTQAITLDPTTATNFVDTDHTVTATILDSLGDPVPGIDVSFEVVSGPNAPDSSDPGECATDPNCVTDASGQTSWTYTGDGGVGDDKIVARFTDADGNHVSREVTKTWELPPFIPVDIDIKPNSDPSSFGCDSKGSIPVAVLGSATFDATSIDADTVRFGAVGNETGEVHEKKGSAKRHVEDFNGDGILDMIFHFDFPSTGFSCADIPAGQNSVTLVGNLTGQDSSGTDIVGSSDIRLTAGKGD